MYAKILRHAGRYNPARDVALALAGSGAGRHRARARLADVTLADLLEPVVPALDFPGFQTLPMPSLGDAIAALEAEHHVRDLRPLPWETRP